MDLLHTQLSNIQRQLSFVSVDPIDWKLYVQAFSWAVTLFESYLLYVCGIGFNSSGINQYENLAYDSIHCILRPSPRLHSRSISSQTRSTSRRLMVRTRPNLPCSQESTSNALTL